MSSNGVIKIVTIDTMTKPASRIYTARAARRPPVNHIASVGQNGCHVVLLVKRSNLARNVD
jgi:hypothetical protein